MNTRNTGDSSVTATTPRREFTDEQIRTAADAGAEAWLDTQGLGDYPWSRIVRAVIDALGLTPPEDEPSLAEYREAYEGWRAKGARAMDALLEIWRMVTEDTEYATFGDDPQVVIDSVRCALTASAAEPDPDLVTWTPEDGPLAEALAGLPDGHPVTITVTAALIRALRMSVHPSVTSASWLRPAPAWDGALVIADSTGDVLWRDADGVYRGGAGDGCDRYTAAATEREYGPCRVLIDADGNHVGGDDE